MIKHKSMEKKEKEKKKKKAKKKKKKKKTNFSRIFAKIHENARIFGKLFVGGTDIKIKFV